MLIYNNRKRSMNRLCYSLCIVACNRACSCSAVVVKLIKMLHKEIDGIKSANSEK